ncbi:putative secreted protein [Pseudonocardia sp. Ae168_Ps1]|uniref:C40 family peptidase n=1 Tax=unclassified Pseudonocardia TaxID=2619320 RepID=UPI00094AA40A|nr:MULTISPECIES: C40 family peptidase [unclassified Pseudonocardia]OLL70502.1 putative secreted protein [Pseudonocardia sp. Ae168_Ps1]OLL71621.1 putative secreted protein [Pseudonocardia sp. Ae263_Ps1]
MDQKKATIALALAAATLTFLAAVFSMGMALLGVLVDGVLPGGGCAGDGGLGGGSQTIGGTDWNAEQTDNAATIVNIVAQRGLPKRAAVIAISTVIVEARLVNVGHGDRDSLGLYQQRPSQGWGTPEQVLNPDYATRIFLDRLIALPGWATMPPGTAAQAVQRSAFPDRYAPQEAPAAALVDRFWVGPDNPVPAAPGAAPNVQLASTAFACPDQGGAGGPLAPSNIDPKKLPPGFVPPADPAQRAAVGYALSQLGKPYIWGAKGPTGFDCSGLMLAAWAAAGVPIPAGTVNQKNAGTPANPATIAAGDLVFIPGSLGSPTNPRHVGMYVGNGLVVNAYDSSTGVILQPLSDWADKITHVRHIAGPAGAPAAAPVPAARAETALAEAAAP